MSKDLYNQNVQAKSDMLSQKLKDVASAVNTKKAQFTSEQLAMDLETFRKNNPDATPFEENEWLKARSYLNDNFLEDLATGAKIAFADNLPAIGYGIAGWATGDDEYYQEAIKQFEEAQDKRKTMTAATQVEMEAVEKAAQERAARLDAEGRHGFVDRSMAEFFGAVGDYVSNPMAAMILAAENVDSIVTAPIGGIAAGSLAKGVVKSSVQRKLRNEFKERMKDVADGDTAAAFKHVMEVKDIADKRILAAQAVGADLSGDLQNFFMEGANNAVGTYQEIMGMDLNEISKTDAFKEMQARNPDATPEQIRQMVAHKEASDTGLQSGLAAAAIGRATGATALTSRAGLDTRTSRQKDIDRGLVEPDSTGSPDKKTTNTDIGNNTNKDTGTDTNTDTNVNNNADTTANNNKDAITDPDNNADVNNTKDVSINDNTDVNTNNNTDVNSNPTTDIDTENKNTTDSPNKDPKDNESTEEQKPSKLKAALAVPGKLARATGKAITTTGKAVSKTTGAVIGWKAAKVGAVESVEEAIQSGAGAAISNSNVQDVDKDKKLHEGVGAAMGSGFVGGAVSGASTSKLGDVLKNTPDALHKAKGYIKEKGNEITGRGDDHTITKKDSVSSIYNKTMNSGKTQKAKNKGKGLKPLMESISQINQSSDLSYSQQNAQFMGVKNGLKSTLESLIENGEVKPDDAVKAAKELRKHWDAEYKVFKERVVAAQKAKAEEFKKGAPPVSDGADKGKVAGSSADSKKETAKIALDFFLSSEGVSDRDLGERLAASSLISDSDKKIVQLVLDNNLVKSSVKNRYDVANEIFNGDEDGDFTGLDEYISGIREALKDKDELALADYLRRMDRFERAQSVKLETGKTSQNKTIPKDLIPTITKEKKAITYVKKLLNDLVKTEFPEFDLAAHKEETDAQLNKLLNKHDLAPRETENRRYTVPQKTRRNIVQKALSALLDPKNKGAAGTEEVLDLVRHNLNKDYGINTDSLAQYQKDFEVIESIESVHENDRTEEEKASLKASKENLNDLYNKLISHYGSLNKLRAAMEEQVEDPSELDAVFEGSVAEHRKAEDTEYEKGHKTIHKATDEVLTPTKRKDHNSRVEWLLDFVADTDNHKKIPKPFLDKILNGEISEISSLDSNQKDKFNELADLMNLTPLPWADVVKGRKNNKAMGTTPKNRVFQNLLEKLSYKDSATRKSLISSPNKIGIVHTEEELMEILKNPEKYPNDYNLIVNETLTEDSKETLKSFVEFYKKFENTLDALVVSTEEFNAFKKKREKEGKSFFGISNYVLDDFLVKNPETNKTELTQEVKLALAIGAMDFITTNLVNSLYNEEATIKAMLGDKSNRSLDERTKRAYRQGTTETLAQEVIGTSVMRIMGFQPTGAADFAYIKQLRANFGALAVATMTSDRTTSKGGKDVKPIAVKRYVVVEGNPESPVAKIKRWVEPENVLKDKEDQKKADEGYKAKYGKERKSKERYIPLLVPTLNENQPKDGPRKFSSKINNAVKVINDSEFTEGFLGVDTGFVPPFFNGKVPNQDNVPWLSELSKEAAKKMSKAAYVPDHDFLNIISLLDPEFRDRLVDNIPTEEMSHISMRGINKARRDKVRRTVDGVLEIYARWRRLGDDNATINFRTQANRSNKRFQMFSSLGDPQNTKLARWAFKLKNQKVTIDWSNENHRKAYIFAVAEALGIKGDTENQDVDKSSDSEVLRMWDKILADKNIMGAAQAIENINSGKSTEADKEALQNFLGTEGETAHKLDGLIALSKWRDDKFEVFTAKENDAVTSGIAISLVQLANVDSFADYEKALSRVAVFIGDSFQGYSGEGRGFGDWLNDPATETLFDKVTGEEYESKANVDSYVNFANFIERFLDNPLKFFEDGRFPRKHLGVWADAKKFFRLDGRDDGDYLFQAAQKIVIGENEYGKEVTRVTSWKGKNKGDQRLYFLNITEDDFVLMSRGIQTIMSQKLYDEETGQFIKVSEAINKVSRNFAKDPLMIFNYGAAIKGLKEAVAGIVTKGIVSLVEDIAALDEEDRADYAEILEEAVNALNILPKGKLAPDRLAQLKERNSDYLAKYREYNALPKGDKGKTSSKGKALKKELDELKKKNQISDEDAYEILISDEEGKGDWRLDLSAPLEQQLEHLHSWSQLAVEFTYGPAMESAFNNLYDTYKDPINKIIQGFRLATMAYIHRYEKRMAEVKKQNKGKPITQEQHDAIEKELKKYEPIMATYLTDADDIENTGISALSNERTKDRYGPDENRVVLPIMTNAENSDKETITSTQASTYSRTPADPGVGTYARLVQSLDAAQIAYAVVFNKQDFVGVHDAGLFGLLNMIEGTQGLNNALIDLAKNYSMFGSFSDMLEKVLTDDLTDEDRYQIIERVNAGSREDLVLDTFGTRHFDEIKKLMAKEAQVRDALRNILMQTETHWQNFNGGSDSSVVTKPDNPLTPEEAAEKFNTILQDWLDELEKGKQLEQALKVEDEFGKIIRRNNVGGVKDESSPTSEKSKQAALDKEKASVATAYIGKGVYEGLATSYYFAAKKLGLLKKAFTSKDVVWVGVDDSGYLNNALGEANKVVGITPDERKAKILKYRRMGLQGRKNRAKTKGKTWRKYQARFYNGKKRKLSRYSMFDYTGKLSRSYRLLMDAVEANATVLTDTFDIINAESSTGQRELAQFLKDQGYVPLENPAEPKFLRWVPKQVAEDSKSQIDETEITDVYTIKRLKESLFDSLDHDTDYDNEESRVSFAKDIKAKILAAISYKVRRKNNKGSFTIKGRTRSTTHTLKANGVLRDIVNNFNPKTKIIFHENYDSLPRSLKQKSKDGYALYSAKEDAIHVFAFNLEKEADETDKNYEKRLSYLLLHEIDHSNVFHALMKAGVNSVPVMNAKYFISLALEDKEYLGKLHEALTKDPDNKRSVGFHTELVKVVSAIKAIQNENPDMSSKEAIDKWLKNSRSNQNKLIVFTAEMSAYAKTDNNVRKWLDKIKVEKERNEEFGAGKTLLFKFLHSVAKLIFGIKGKDITLYQQFIASMVPYNEYDTYGVRAKGYTKDWMEVLAADESTVTRGFSKEDKPKALEALKAVQGIVQGITSELLRYKEKNPKNKGNADFYDWLDSEASEKFPIFRHLFLEAPNDYLFELEDVAELKEYSEIHRNFIRDSLDENGKIAEGSILERALKAVGEKNRGGKVEIDPAIVEQVLDNLGMTQEHEDSYVASDIDLYHRMESEQESYVNISPSNMKKIFDGLGQYDSSVKPSAEHKAQLEGVMDVINPLLSEVTMYLYRTRGETQGSLSGRTMEININLGSKVHSLEMSPQEIMVHELLHSFLWSLEKNSDKSGVKGKSTKYYRAIENEYDIVRENLKPEDFLAGIKNPTEMDKEKAQKMYDHVIHNKIAGYTTLTTYLGTEEKVLNANPVDEFIVHTLTNEPFRKAVSAMKVRTKAESSKTFFDKILNIFKMMSRLVNRDIHTLSGLDRSDRIEHLVGMLVNTQKKREGLIQRTQDKAESAYDWVDDKIKSALRKSKWVDGMASTKEVLDGRPEDKKKVRRAIGKWIWGKNQFVADVSSELTIGRKSMSELIRLLMKSTKMVEQKSQNLKEFMVRNVESNLPDMTNDQQRSIYYGAMKADLSSLVDSYTIEEIAKLIQDEEVLNDAIVKLQANLKALLDSTGNKDDLTWMRNNAEDLGYYLVTGERLYGAGFATNSYQIVNKFGLPKRYKKKKIPEGLQEMVDSLATLYALRYTPHKLDSRFTENTTELEFIIRTQQELKQAALEHTFKDSEFNYRKGYIAEEFSQDVEVRIADVSDEKRLLNQGFKRGEEAPSDPLMSKNSKRYYYVRSTNGLTSYRSGIFSIKGDKVRGQELFPIHNTNAKEAYLNTVHFRVMKNQREKLLREMYSGNMGKLPPQMRHQIAGTRFTEEGYIFGFNQETSEKVKDTLLGREFDLGKQMGTTISSINRKVQTKDLNREAVDHLFAVYQKEYDDFPTEFMHLSPESETFKLLPSDTQEYLLKKFGKAPIMVRREQWISWFGYRKFSIRDLELMTKDNEKEWGAFRVAMNNLFVKFLQNEFGLKAEEYWVHFVKFAKDTLVVKSWVVTVGNILSNIALLWVAGVPLATALKDTVECYTRMYEYKKLQNQFYDLDSQRQNPMLSAESKKEIDSKMAVIDHRMRNSPVHDLIEAGLYQTIVEDIEVSEQKGALAQKAETMFGGAISKLPKGVKTVASEVLMLHGSKMYEIAREFAQLSDFSARYSLHKRNIQKGMTFDESVHNTMITFIPYDLPINKGLQALNDYGLLGFTTFLLKVQNVIVSSAINSPSRFFSLLAMQNLTGIDIPDIADSAITGFEEILKRMYSPFDWLKASGELFTLDALGNAVS